MTPLFEDAGGRRYRRVVAGQGMCTPAEPLVLKENGKTEQLIPGRVRFIRNHPLVLKHPEWFKPADPKDFETYRRHRQLLETTRRQIEREMAGTTRATTSSRQKRFQLREGRPGRFHLR